MRVSTDGSGWLHVNFGSGFAVKVLGDARAILDLSSQTLPAQIEYVSLVEWAARSYGEHISIPSAEDLGDDAWCLQYDRAVDCLMVRLYQDSRRLAPFNNREVLASLSIDHGGLLCGVSVLLKPSEVNQIIQRFQR